MLFEELIHRFKEEKNQAPLHANELLDFIQKCYIQSDLTIADYKRLYSELVKRNAEKPDAYFFNTNQNHLEKIHLPG